MSVKQLRGRVQHKKKTEAEWYLDVYVSAGSAELREDPFIPFDGELIIFEKDDTHENDRFKFGDGEANVMDLPFASTEQADWNQMDETKSGFIKNRTHYDNFRSVSGEATSLYLRGLPVDEGPYSDVSITINIKDTGWIDSLYGKFKFYPTIITHKFDVYPPAKSQEDPLPIGEFSYEYDGEEWSKGLYTSPVGCWSDDGQIDFAELSDFLGTGDEAPSYEYTWNYYEGTEPVVKQLDSKYIPIDETSLTVNSETGKLKTTGLRFAGYITSASQSYEKLVDNVIVFTDEYIKELGLDASETYSLSNTSALCQLRKYNEETGKFENVSALSKLNFPINSVVFVDYKIDSYKNEKYFKPQHLYVYNGKKWVDITGQKYTLTESDNVLTFTSNDTLEVTTITLPQADWSELDVESKNYIKNRTHGYEYETRIKEWVSRTFYKEDVESNGYMDIGIPSDAKNILIDTSGLATIYEELESLPTEPLFLSDYTSKSHTEYGEDISGQLFLHPDGYIYSDNGTAEDEWFEVTVTYDEPVYETVPVLKQLDSKYIPLELERGAVEKSLQTPGATALTESSIALGEGSIAGCKGYFIEAIDFYTKRLYLSTKQADPRPQVCNFVFMPDLDTDSVEPEIYDNGIKIRSPYSSSPLQIISGKRKFNIYKVTSGNVTIKLIPATSRYRIRIFVGKVHEGTYTVNKEPLTLTFNTSEYIVAQLDSEASITNAEFSRIDDYYKDHMEIFFSPFQKNDEFYYDSDVAGKHFYTINKTHYITDASEPGILDATISSIQGNCITWKGDIGYSVISPNGPIAYYDYSFMIPDCPDPGENATGLKPAAITMGENSHSIGRASFVIGNNNKALQDYSFIGGQKSQAGYMSLSFGYLNNNNGSYSAIVGGRENTIHKQTTEAAILGGYKNVIETGARRSVIAGGYQNKIMKDCGGAFAAGTGLIVNVSNQAVFGQYNEASSDKIFIIGNGVSDKKQNAFTIDWYGRVTAGADPIYAMDLTTKQYVDNKAAANNRTGATNTSDKIYLVGATTQSYNPITYTHDTVYIDIDGCVYSDGKKVATEEYVNKLEARIRELEERVTALDGGKKHTIVFDNTYPCTEAYVDGERMELTDGETRIFTTAGSVVVVPTEYDELSEKDIAVIDEFCKNGQYLILWNDTNVDFMSDYFMVDGEWCDYCDTVIELNGAYCIVYTISGRPAEQVVVPYLHTIAFNGASYQGCPVYDVFVNGETIYPVPNGYTVNTFGSVVFNYDEYLQGDDKCEAMLMNMFTKGTYVILAVPEEDDITIQDFTKRITIDGAGITEEGVVMIELGSCRCMVYTISGEPAENFGEHLYPYLNWHDAWQWVTKEEMDGYDPDYCASTFCGSCDRTLYYDCNEFSDPGNKVCPYCGDIT